MLSGRIIGIPPPTAASNKKFLLCCWAILINSAPYFATSSLFDVQTLLPASNADLTKSYDGLSPPITSIITSTSGSFKIIL